MNIRAKILVATTVGIMAAGAAEARGPAAQPWIIYPTKAMNTCRAGTAPSHIAKRCDDLLAAYSRELEACVPMRRGGPVIREHQIALEQSNPECAAAAAKTAAAKVK